MNKFQRPRHALTLFLFLYLLLFASLRRGISERQTVMFTMSLLQFYCVVWVELPTVEAARLISPDEKNYTDECRNCPIPADRLLGRQTFSKRCQEFKVKEIQGHETESGFSESPPGLLWRTFCTNVQKRILPNLARIGPIQQRHLQCARGEPATSVAG
jgi:hypothetical protein